MKVWRSVFVKVYFYDKNYALIVPDIEIGQCHSKHKHEAVIWIYKHVNVSAVGECNIVFILNQPKQIALSSKVQYSKTVFTTSV